MVQPRQPCDHPFFDHPGPLAFAHRGYARDGLENTMAAFQNAVDLGYRYIETDARSTRDGVVLAYHDATLHRLTGRPGRIADLRWHDVRTARVGGAEPVAALEDVLARWPDLRLNIDVKDAATVPPLARVIERMRAHDRLCIASFSDRRRRAVLRRLSAAVATSAGLPTVAMVGATIRVPGALGVSLRGIDCLQVPAQVGVLPMVTAHAVAAVHRFGRQVHAWTVNDAATAHRLLALGVDGLITDRAEIIRRVLEERGQWATR